MPQFTTEYQGTLRADTGTSGGLDWPGENRGVCCAARSKDPGPAATDIDTKLRPVIGVAVVLAATAGTTGQLTGIIAAPDATPDASDE
jgi:hypothetical protein